MATQRGPGVNSADELETLIETLLADPAHHENPLRAALTELFRRYEGQRERLQRLVHISDGYHSISREHNERLSQRYDRQSRYIARLVRISDRYQNNLRELSESLREASLHDPLTGLGNRRFLLERLKTENERARRRKSPYSVVILDADHFKLINDRFGHEAGDSVLCEIAEAIASSLREYDHCGRWGGEEFLILLPETGGEEAHQVAERVRRAIEAIIPVKAQGSSISASLGIATWHPDESHSETINRADTALLRAKALGRNRVEMAA